MTSNTSSLFRYLFVFFVSACGFGSQALACVPEEGNKLEEAFCKLKKRPQGAGLPTLFEFRQNPPLTQALLIKKPAARIGIEVKIPERKNREVVRLQEVALLRSVKPATKPETPFHKKQIQQSDTDSSIMTTSVQPESLLGEGELENISSRIVDIKDLSDTCRLDKTRLHCGGKSYRLVTNQINQHLREGVLSDSHRLNLPRNDGEDSETYLHKAYSRYLHGMMEIGLGATTSTYTKFVFFHDYMGKHGMDFVNRFEETYSLLKKEKSSIGVDTKPAIDPGFTASLCSELDNLMACEHQSNNYLFKQVSP